MSANLDLDLLRSFVGVAEAGGFRRAAGILHRTQPAITQQIQRLEDQVGAPVFRRDSRGVTLTEAGQDLLGYARRILALNDEALRHMRGPRALPARTRMGVIQDVAESMLPDILETFSADHGEGLVEVHVDMSDTLYDRLDRGELDLVLAAASPRRPRDAVVRREPLVWLASEALAIEGAQPLPIVLCNAPCRIHDIALEALLASGVTFRIACLSPNLSGLLAAVRAGLGITARGAAFARPPLATLEGRHGLPALPSLHLVLARGPTPANPATDALAGIIRSCL